MSALQKIIKSIRDDRFDQDFEQIKKIGRGGYSSVYNAKNILDDQYYAVKKITLRVKDIAKKNMEQEIERVLEEARILAKISHPNVLRYYNSWLEVTRKDESEKTFFNDNTFSEAPSITIPKRNQRNSLKNSAFLEEIYDERESSFNDDIEFIEENDSILQFENEPDQEEVDNVEFTDQSPIVRFEGREKRNLTSISKGPIMNYLGKTGSESTESSEKPPERFERNPNLKLTLNRLSDIRPSRAQNGMSLPRLDVKSPVNKIKFNAVDSKIQELKNGTNFSEFMAGRQSKPIKPRYSIADLQEDISRMEQNDPNTNPLALFKSITLYIQTELCKQTLEGYIAERNSLLEKKRDPDETKNERKKYMKEALKIGLQMLDALVYIHNNMMVHRDLKPSNIFLTNEGIIKIGDFGLVKKLKFFIAQQASPMLSGAPTPEKKSFIDSDVKNEAFTLDDNTIGKNCEFELKIDDDERLSGAEDSPCSKYSENMNSDDDDDNGYSSNSSKIMRVKSDEADNFIVRSLKANGDITRNAGTKTFASPEQLSADITSFDARADIWSLGIIYLLLFHPMSTVMEQTQAINQSKDGIMPKSFENEHPIIAALIKRMLSKEPKDRPSLLEIENELKRPEECTQKYNGKVKLRRENCNVWKDRWLRVTDESLFFYKNQNENKAQHILNRAQWKISLSREIDRNQDCNKNDNILREKSGLRQEKNILTYINIENSVQLGCHITTCDSPTTREVYQQLISD